MRTLVALALLALPITAQGSWIESQPTEWPTSPPVDVSAADIAYSYSRMRDPAPAANEPPAWWERAYQELEDAGYANYVRPGSASRPDAPHELWEKQAFLDHLLRQHGKGGHPLNPRGKWYYGQYTWGVGQSGWRGMTPMIYLTHRYYHFQGALFGQPWGNIAWWMPVKRSGYGTRRPTGTTAQFMYWDSELDWKARFLWWRWFKETGICHPFCIGAWKSRCGQNCVTMAEAGPIKVREVLGAGVPTDIALRSMAESFALFEREHARGWDKVRTWR